MVSHNRPVVLAIGGHDPTGGAGIQADIEAIAACGGQPVSLVTALTAQNTMAFEAMTAADADALRRQAAVLAADMPIAAVKIGLIPTPGVAAAVSDILAAHPRLPVVLDPVLGSGSGARWADEALCEAIGRLLARATVATPNGPELRRLGGSDDLDRAADALLARGCRHVLATGTHERTAAVRNTLYAPTRRLTWVWPRLPEVYHGSGCTLASALTAFLARGLEADSAAGLAQEYTYDALKHARRYGQAQWHPQRLFQLDRSP